ncbi:energy-dependent translational throttle protein EttA [Spirochaetota bacterium]|nr:energy-dependent translational throttle protein EttA [Spirochaetota bacterium]
MAEKIIFSMNGVSKIVPPRKNILNNVSLSFYYGAKIGVIGINGAGKSTLLKIIAGIEKDYDGEVTYDKNIVIGYLPQEPQLDPNLTVSENIKAGLKETLDLLAEFNDISNRLAESLSEEEMNKLMTRMGVIQEELEKKDAWEIERKVEMIMNALHAPSDDMEVAKLSGGERRRVSLCRLLIEKPDVLILDEPTNHLDAESVAWLEEFLISFPGTVLTVTHDRYFLDNVADWILELENGCGYPFKGNYSDWLAQKEERLRLAEKSQSQRQKALKRELQWIRENTRGQQKKNKARITAYENLLANANDKKLEQMEIRIPIPPRLGEQVSELENISKSFGSRVLIRNFSMLVPRGAIVGIIGANGMGKTTLFKMLIGEEKPDAGSIHIGSTVLFSHVGQFRDNLNPNDNIWQAISEGQEEISLGTSKIHSRAYVGSFNFKGTDQQKKVGTLSGGERNRVHLARLLRSGGNVLLLDEPTNDLDIGTLRALEDALLAFAGCVLVISHDRYFLDRIATHILAFEEKGHLVFHAGNFTDYEAYKTQHVKET